MDSEQGNAWVIPANTDCEHEKTFQLGSDKGNNIYLQCQECDAVIILESEDYNIQKEREEIEKKMEEDESILGKLTSK